jgi:hypothetical protein
MTTQTLIDSINKAFRIPPGDMPKLSTANDRPNYDTLFPFQKALDKNAISIPCTQTTLGYLALTRSAEAYLTASSGIPFVVPVDPGATPIQPTLAADTVDTRAQRAQQIAMLPFSSVEAVRNFNAQKHEYQQYIAVQTALKNLILNNVAPQYINALRQELTDFALVTPLQLMTHLWTQYGQIDQTALTENEARMKTPWMPPVPIETLFKQLTDGQIYANKGHETISDENLMRWAYDNIHNTGLFEYPCRDWRQYPAPKTWINFQTHFAAADLDRKNSTTTSDASYTANMVKETVQTEMMNLFDTLSTNTDNSNLTEPSTAPPPSQESDASSNYMSAASIQQLIDASINQVMPPPATRPNDRRRSRNTPTTRTPRGPQKCQAVVDGYPVTYCWTHGVTRNLAHNSATCQRTAEGHVKEATYDDRKGGSNATVQPPSRQN